MNSQYDPQLSVILDRFDSAWLSETVPEIADFLPEEGDFSESARKSVLIELVIIDLEHRWRSNVASDAETLSPDTTQAGAQPTLEDYVARYPELGPVDSLPIGPICWEYRIRQQWGDRPDHSSFFHRFQAQADELLPALAKVDRELLLNPTLEHRSSQARAANSTESLPEIPGYLVTAEIARGGMGRVLAARELALDREVAIKVLLPSADPDASARFVTEAKITARLPHPGVPPAFAQGTLEDGSPYLAMKRVDGNTLAELLEGRDSVTDELPKWIGIFDQVCQTVAFAHKQGVLHRDLKPANIMVGAFGEVHVMDWGLGRQVESSGQSTAGQTQSNEESEAGSASARADWSAEKADTVAGTVMGTPAYMSPEQARGEAVDSRADVFALGSLLSVILTGEPAFVGGSSLGVIKKAALGELDEAFARLDACQADRELIELAKQCLSADANARPADGQEVATTISQYRADVDTRLREAQAEQAATQARMVEQRKRRRVVLLGAGIVTLLLLIGGTAVAFQWWRAENALTDLTEQQGKTQEKVVQLTTARKLSVDQLESITEAVGNWAERQAALTTAEQKFIDQLLPMWEELAAERGDLPETRALRAKGHFRVGYLKNTLGEFAKAEQEFRRALDLYTELVEEFPSDHEYRHVSAIVYFNLAKALDGKGLQDQAEDHYATALTSFKTLRANDPDSEDYRRGLAMTHINLAVLHEKRGASEDAKRIYEDAIRLIDALTVEFPDNQIYQRGEAICHDNLGVVFQKLGRTKEAEEQFRIALPIRESLVSENLQVAIYRNELADTQSKLGVMATNRGETKIAEKLLNSALRNQEVLVQEFPSVPKFRLQLARTHGYLGLMLSKDARPDEAIKQFRLALAVSQKLLAEFPENTDYKHAVASGHVNVAAAFLGKGNRKDAEAEWRAGLEMFDQILRDTGEKPEMRYHRNRCAQNLGGVLVELGEYAEAEMLLREALAGQESLITKFPKHPEYPHAKADIIENLGLMWNETRPSRPGRSGVSSSSRIA